MNSQTKKPGKNLTKPINLPEIYQRPYKLRKVRLLTFRQASGGSKMKNTALKKTRRSINRPSKL